MSKLILNLYYCIFFNEENISSASISWFSTFSYMSTYSGGKVFPLDSIEFEFSSLIESLLAFVLSYYKLFSYGLVFLNSPNSIDYYVSASLDVSSLLRVLDLRGFLSGSSLLSSP